MYVSGKFPYISYAVIGTVGIAAFYQLTGSLIAIYAKEFNFFLMPWLTAFSQLFLMLLPVILISRYSPMSFKKIFRLEKLPSLSFLMLALAGTAALTAAQSGIYSLQNHLLPESVKPFFESWEKEMMFIYKKSFSGEGFLNYVKILSIAALIPCISEEFLFRGFMQTHLERKMKPAAAIVITALVFDLVHFNPVTFLPLLLISLFLCILAYLSRSILLPMIVHFINNVLAVIQFKTNYQKGAEELEPVMPAGDAFLMFFTSVVILAFIVLLLVKISKNLRPAANANYP